MNVDRFKRYRIFIAVLVCLNILCWVIYRESREFFPSKEVSSLDSESGEKESFERVSYEKNGIRATYPRILAGGTKEQVRGWNNIISSDFNKILQIYSFNPIPGPTPAPSAEIPSMLEISFEMKLLNDHLISIFYVAYFNAEYAAHPTELVYTTNINKDSGNRIRLGDVVDINQRFVENFRNWTLVTHKEESVEWHQAVKDYMNSISDEDLLKGFEAADLFGSQNLWGINSYFTPDKLGISMGVPNYIGDHVEFEESYSNLKDFLKHDMILE